MRVLVITLGATALQKFDEASGTMQLGVSPNDLLAQAAVAGCDAELHQMPVRRCVSGRLSLQCMCKPKPMVQQHHGTSQNSHAELLHSRHLCPTIPQWG